MGEQVSWVILAICKVNKKIFDTKHKGFLCWGKSPTIMLGKRRSTSIKSTKNFGLWQRTLKCFKKRDMVQNVGKNWRKLKFCK